MSRRKPLPRFCASSKRLIFGRNRNYYGYGQNFLIKKGFAKKATDEVIKEWEEQQKKLALQKAKEIEDLTILKNKIESIKINIKKKLGSNGSLFGAVTAKDIEQIVKDKYKLDIDKKSFDIKKAIKATGSYEIDVKLGHGIHAKLNVEVEAE